MNITLHLPMHLPGGIAYNFTGPAEMRVFLSRLISPEQTLKKMSVDAAYMLAALAARGEILPRTDEERHAAAERRNQIQAAPAVANT